MNRAPPSPKVGAIRRPAQRGGERATRSPGGFAHCGMLRDAPGFVSKHLLT